MGHTHTDRRAVTLGNTSINRSWPLELQQLKEAYEAAYTAFLTLDAQEAANIREHGDLAERQALRELAVQAYSLKCGIDELGSRLLGQWDEDSCGWRRIAPDAVN